MNTWLIVNLIILVIVGLLTWRGFAVDSASNQAGLVWLMLASAFLVGDIISEIARWIFS